MVHTCMNCKQTFSTQLELALHRDTCTDAQLFCEMCGERFGERDATKDGWHFECPDADCTGRGINEDLHRVRDAISVSR